MDGRTDGWAMSFLMMSYGDGLRTTGRKEHPSAAVADAAVVGPSVGEGKVIDGHLAPPLAAGRRSSISAALPTSTRHPENNTNSNITIYCARRIALERNVIEGMTPASTGGCVGMLNKNGYVVTFLMSPTLGSQLPLAKFGTRGLISLMVEFCIPGSALTSLTRYRLSTVL